MVINQLYFSGQRPLYYKLIWSFQVWLFLVSEYLPWSDAGKLGTYLTLVLTSEEYPEFPQLRATLTPLKSSIPINFPKL